jgi:DUF971 family protein
MTASPIRLYRVDDATLGIEWSDGQRRAYATEELRRNCPCATCNSRRDSATGDPPAEGVTVAAMTPVGNYAYKIRFSDGHDTGLFTLELLRELGREVP